MSEHPGDNAKSRLSALWAGVVAFLSFGVVALLLFPGKEAAVGVTPEMQAAIDTRVNHLKEVRAAQEALVSPEKAAAAESATLAVLRQKKPVKSPVLVPGSDAFLQQMQAAAAPAPEKEAAKDPTEETPMPAEQQPAPPKKPGETKPKSETPPEPSAKPAPEKAKAGEAMTAAEPKTEAPEAGKPKADPAAIEAAMTLGKAKFMICGACHGPDGKGLPLGPGMFMAPGYAESAIVKRESAEMFALVILKGIAKEDAKYMGIMAPLEASLNDEDLAAILTYVRNEFSGHADLVTPEQVAGWRAKYKAITSPVKRGELEKIVKETP